MESVVLVLWFWTRHSGYRCIREAFLEQCSQSALLFFFLHQTDRSAQSSLVEVSEVRVDSFPSLASARASFDSTSRLIALVDVSFHVHSGAVHFSEPSRAASSFVRKQADPTVASLTLVLPNLVHLGLVKLVGHLDNAPQHNRTTTPQRTDWLQMI